LGLAQFSGNGESVLSGQHYVQHQKIELLALLKQASQGGLPVTYNFRLVALGLEVELQAAREVFFILNYKYLRAHC
jgi:hypothetical protein